MKQVNVLFQKVLERRFRRNKHCRITSSQLSPLVWGNETTPWLWQCRLSERKSRQQCTAVSGAKYPQPAASMCGHRRSVVRAGRRWGSQARTLWAQATPQSCRWPQAATAFLVSGFPPVNDILCSRVTCSFFEWSCRSCVHPSTHNCVHHLASNLPSNSTEGLPGAPVKRAASSSGAHTPQPPPGLWSSAPSPHRAPKARCPHAGCSITGEEGISQHPRDPLLGTTQCYSPP